MRINFMRHKHLSAFMARSWRMTFYAYGKKDVIRPLPCSSFPTATRFAERAVGEPPHGRHFSFLTEISILTALCISSKHVRPKSGLITFDIPASL